MSDEKLGELAAALSKAQGAMRAAEKDRTNPHFRSTYATLAAVWDACRAHLSANGLAVVQLVSAADRATVTVESRLLHTSGASLVSSLTMPVAQATAQGVGSAITYARRYALAALVGVAPDDDDDGNAASKPPDAKPADATRGSVVARLVKEPEAQGTSTISRINAAASIEALAEIGMEIASMPERERTALRPTYAQKYAELAARIK